MKERPILFGGPMVRAILDGTKTQTRRVIRPDWLRCLDPDDPDDPDGRASVIAGCRYGVPGDRLWVREAWRLEDEMFEGPESGYSYVMTYAIDGEVFPESVYWRPGRAGGKPSIHMPRGLSRITLEVTNVRVERLHAISEEDAKAEGVKPFPFNPEGDCWTDGKHVTAFNHLWNEINGWSPNAWDANPWVWVVEFRRIRP